MKRERLRTEPYKGFEKGKPRPEGAGRVKGTKNRMTTLLKEALIMAAECEGDNKEGRDGLVGYLRIVARREPAVFCRMLEKLLPMQVTGADGSPVQLLHTTPEQVRERFKERGLPLPQSLMEVPFHRMKDVTPTPKQDQEAA